MARAVVPVLAGLAVLGLLFGFLWLIAVVVTRNADDADRRIGADVFEVGRVDRLADSVEANGPILFPNLSGPAGERPVGLVHDGATDFEGWRVFSLQPPSNAPDCLVVAGPGDQGARGLHGRDVHVRRSCRTPSGWSCSSTRTARSPSTCSRPTSRRRQSSGLGNRGRRRSFWTLPEPVRGSSSTITRRRGRL